MAIVREAFRIPFIVQCVLVDIMPSLEIQVVQFAQQVDILLMQVITVRFVHEDITLILDLLVVLLAVKGI